MFVDLGVDVVIISDGCDVDNDNIDNEDNDGDDGMDDGVLALVRFVFSFDVVRFGNSFSCAVKVVTFVGELRSVEFIDLRAFCDCFFDAFGVKKSPKQMLETFGDERLSRDLS